MLSSFIAAFTRRRKAAAPKRANLNEVLSFIERANATQLRAIINSVNEKPSYMRRKEVAYAR